MFLPYIGNYNLYNTAAMSIMKAVSFMVSKGCP